MLKRILCPFLSVVMVLSLVMPGAASAQERISFIRDAEIESTIRTYATPLWNAAGLDAASVRIYLVNDPRLNAFVAGGQNLFINTGLIMRSQTPNQLIGVIAHETGHIAGGHLVRTQEALRNATAKSIVAMVIGVAAAVLAKGNGASGALLGSGAQVGQNSFLMYSVEQESKADAAGMSFLEQTGQSARGLYEFFQILNGQDLLAPSRQDPYLRTHPLTRQRMEAVEVFLQHSRYSKAEDSQAFIEEHKRIKAKLAGFMNAPAQTLAQYKADDPSIAARYARAVAYYRIPDLAKALPLVEGLIKDEPKNPYFHELKGQMLYENGRIAESIAPYEESVRLRPDSALLRLGLAQAMLETGDTAFTKRALAHLNDAVRTEDRNSNAWRLLAIAHGRDGNIGMSALALAEEALADGNKKQADQQAQRAIQLLPAGTPARIRAQDIKEAAKNLNERG